MSLVGLQMHDPRTGVHVHVLDVDEEEGRGFQLEYIVPPGGPREVVMRHGHVNWTEHFEVLEGKARYRLGRSEADLSAGEGVELPAGIPHLHPWNIGDTQLRVRQNTVLGEPSLDAVRETILAFAMLFWLSREGRVDARGAPPPLQAALILQTLQQQGGFLPGLPLGIQRTIINGLAYWGRRRGYVAFDPRCLDV